MNKGLKLQDFCGMKGTYENAIAFIEGSRHKRVEIKETPNEMPSPNGMSNLNDLPDQNGVASLRGSPSLKGMKEWLQLLHHPGDDLNSMRIIHVAGTKGKGSTCAFTRSLLTAHGKRTGFPQRIGLYTGPHLKCIRERIQIDGEPISKQLFADCFYEIKNRLSGHDSQPRRLQFLALLSFQVFIKEKVDLAIYETHHGGEYDVTNVIQSPVVTAITSLGMDHIEQLGPSIENIAWHKAGIFKPESTAFSAPQDLAAVAVLQRRAAEKGIPLEFIAVDPVLPDEPAVEPHAQKINCSLAIAVARAWLKSCSPNEVLEQEDISQGIKDFSWPGRFHQINDRNYHWFLDVAHNEMSLSGTVQWFVLKIQSDPLLARVLIFSHISERDGASLVRCVAESMRMSGVQMQHIIFTTYQERQDDTAIEVSKHDESQFGPDIRRSYATLWETFDPKAQVFLESSIEGALNLAKEIGDRGNGMETLVTGSHSLVGSALRLLESNK